MPRLPPAALLLVLLAPVPAAAEQHIDPDVLWDQAQEAREQGDLVRAEGLLRRAFELSNDGVLACEIGRTARAGGRGASAIAWLLRCAERPDLPAAERLEARREARALQLRGSLLRLRGGAPGQLVVVDGAPPEEAPVRRDVALPPGPRRVEILDSTTGARLGGGTLELRGGRIASLDPATLVTATVPAPSASRAVPAWALWTSLAVTLAAAAGSGVALWQDIELSGEVGRERDASDARLASALLGGFAGVGLAATIVLVPYVLAWRGTAPQPGAEHFGPGRRTALAPHLGASDATEVAR